MRKTSGGKTRTTPSTARKRFGLYLNSNTLRILVLTAKFGRARLHSRIISPDVDSRRSNLQACYAEYQWIMAYAEKFDVKIFQEELALCREMVTLPPPPSLSSPHPPPGVAHPRSNRCAVIARLHARCFLRVMAAWDVRRAVLKVDQVVGKVACWAAVLLPCCRVSGCIWGMNSIRFDSLVCCARGTERAQAPHREGTRRQKYAGNKGCEADE